MSDHDTKPPADAAGPISGDEYEQRMMDPHGFHTHDAHKGHTIISGFTLAAVLTVLLFFTILTVVASRGEVWIAQTFEVAIPQWVNVAIAMTIAVIKASLVCMFFMQLKYDNKLNTVIFLFCLFAAALFLGLTAIDLGQRDSIYDWKSGEVVRGGRPVQITRGMESISNPIALYAKDKYIQEHGEEAWAEEMARLDAEKAHHSPFDPPAHSTADKSRPGVGVNDPMFGGAGEQSSGDAAH